MEDFSLVGLSQCHSDRNTKHGPELYWIRWCSGFLVVPTILWFSVLKPHAIWSGIVCVDRKATHVLSLCDVDESCYSQPESMHPLGDILGMQGAMEWTGRIKDIQVCFGNPQKEYHISSDWRWTTAMGRAGKALKGYLTVLFWAGGQSLHIPPASDSPVLTDSFHW